MAGHRRVRLSSQHRARCAALAPRCSGAGSGDGPLLDPDRDPAAADFLPGSPVARLTVLTMHDEPGFAGRHCAWGPRVTSSRRPQRTSLCWPCAASCGARLPAAVARRPDVQAGPTSGEPDEPGGGRGAAVGDRAYQRRDRACAVPQPPHRCGVRTAPMPPKHPSEPGASSTTRPLQGREAGEATRVATIAPVRRPLSAGRDLQPNEPRASPDPTDRRSAPPPRAPSRPMR